MNFTRYCICPASADIHLNFSSLMIHFRRVPEFLSAQGNKLKLGYNQLADNFGISFTRCSGFGCRTIVTFDASIGNPLEMKSFVQQELIKRGILWTGFHNMSFSHTDADIEYTLSAYNEILPMLKTVVEGKNVRAALRGEPVEPVFRKTSNFNIKPKRAA